MAKLFKYDKTADAWVFVDYGAKSKTREDTLQGYVVVYICEHIKIK